MTTLRALVGAYAMLAFMGFVVSVPLGWTIVLATAATSPEKIVQGQSYQRNNELVRKKILPRIPTYEQIKYKIAAKEQPERTQAQTLVDRRSTVPLWKSAQ